MYTDSRPAWPPHIVAIVALTAVAALAAALLGAPARSDASSGDVDGVRAQVKGGTLDVNGGNHDDALALRLKAGNPNRIQVDVGDDGSADFSFARKDISAIDVRTAGGGDSVRVDDANGPFTDAIPTRLAGGDDDDALTGGLGAEAFSGGAGNDRIAGAKGNDTASLGAGRDTFRWDPGDGSDDIDGQDGRDAMLFNGAGVDETVTMTAAGKRLVFVRNPGNVTMDTTEVETVDFNALGGADTVTVNNLKGTDVTQTNLDLAGTLGGAAADGAVDNVIVNATDGDDEIHIDGNGAGADVTGLATAVSLTHADPTDKLSVNTFAGTDNVLTNGVAGVLQVVVDGAAV
jgi:hypothetical protein